MHVETSFVRNLGGLIRARLFFGPVQEGVSRTLNMYADEESDWAIVPEKRPNKGRELPAEVVEERAWPEGNSRRAAAVRTQSRVSASIWLAIVRRVWSGSIPLLARRSTRGRSPVRYTNGH